MIKVLPLPQALSAKSSFAKAGVRASGASTSEHSDNGGAGQSLMILHHFKSLKDSKKKSLATHLFETKSKKYN